MRTIQPTTNHLRLLASVKGELWMMHGDSISSFAIGCIDAAEKAEGEFDMSDFFDMRKPATIDDAGIAHVQIKGALLNKTPAIYEKLGLATRYQTIIDETSAAVDAGASGIVYHVDSPGGTVAGVVEAGAAMRDAGVPTSAHCSGMACSAAYWLASQTDFITAELSAEVGNIGAILSWTDCSAFWDSQGVEFRALTSEGADLKSTFHLEPDEAQVAFLQDRINAAGKDFREAVTDGRKAAGAELDDEIWRAGWYSGESAYKLGLVDEIGAADVSSSFVLDNRSTSFTK